MPNLFDLPNELLCHILKELEPLDLLRIGRVCKLALIIVSDRAVWEGALRQVYARDSLFEPSFEPIHSMDLDGLRKAAFRTQRVYAKLSNGSGRVQPTRETLLNCPTEGVHVRYITGVQMVPGGRYVLGVASNKHICLWDLGPPGSTPGGSEGTLLCTEDVECEEIRSISCPSQVSRYSFRFAVYVSGQDRVDQWINIYSVEFLPEFVPRIQHLSDHNRGFKLNLIHPQEPVRYWIAGDKVFVQHTGLGFLIVWDFVSATVASVLIPRDAADKPFEFIGFGNSVVALQDDGLYVSQLQDLQTFDPADLSAGSLNAGQIPMQHAKYQDNIHTDTGPGARRAATTFLLPSNWLSSDALASASTTFHTICHDHSHSFMKVKRLRLSSSNKSEVGSTVLSINSDSWFDLFWLEQFRHYSRSGNNLYFLEGSAVVSLHYSSLEGGKDQAQWQFVKCVLGHDIRGRASTLLCPYSGRFAYVCRTPHPDGCNRIHVIDLLDQ